MPLLAIAMGLPGDEDALVCCAFIPVLPLVILLAGWAVFRNSAWAALLALLLVGSLEAISFNLVAQYQPSADGDLVEDQAQGRRTVGLYAKMSVVPILSVLWVSGRRLLQRRLGHGKRAPTTAGAESFANSMQDLQAQMNRLSPEQRDAIRRLFVSGRTAEAIHETSRTFGISLADATFLAKKLQE